MNDRERNQLDAGHTTYDYLQLPPNVLIWTPLGAFAEGVGKVGGSLGIIHTLIQIQAGKTEGITGDKDRLRQSVENRVVILAKAALSYGKATGNGDLVAQADALNSKSELEAIADALLADTAFMLHDRAKEARDLDPAKAEMYGLKKDSEDILLAPVVSAAIAFDAVVSSPRTAIVRRAGATNSLDAELHRLQAIFKDDLDNLIAQFEADHADFVRDYFATRKIIDRGSSGKSDSGNGNAPAPTGP